MTRDLKPQTIAAAFERYGAASGETTEGARRAFYAGVAFVLCDALADPDRWDTGFVGERDWIRLTALIGELELVDELRGPARGDSVR